MATLIPTPVTLEDLVNEASDINLFNDGVKTQVASPRTISPQVVVVQVTDDPTAVALSSGVANANVLNSLVDTTVDFVALGVAVGDSAINTASGAADVVTSIITTTNPNDTLVFATDIFPLGTEAYKVIGAAYWEQKFGLGEWKRSGTKYGVGDLVAYTLPVDTNVVNVHQIVYPWDLVDIANYPAK